jgi:hypothetical protein
VYEKPANSGVFAGAWVAPTFAGLRAGGALAGLMSVAPTKGLGLCGVGVGVGRGRKSGQ